MLYHCRTWQYLLVFLLLVSAVPNNAYSQTSNKGTDFWVAYTGHVNATESRLTLFVTSEYNTQVNVTAGGVALPMVNLVANQAQSIIINPGIYPVYVDGSDAVESKKGIHVTSTLPIALYSHISYAARSAAALIFPTNALGREYYAVSYQDQPGTSNQRKSQFTIVGIEDGTTVEIKPIKKDIASVHQANSTVTKVLNKGDVYQYQSYEDLTGSYIVAKDCKPIAVFSGSSWIGFCEPGNNTGPTGADNLYQQLLPVSAWGKKFVTAPFYNTEHGSVDIFRIQIAEDNTVVKVNGSTTLAGTTTLSNPYEKGSVITFFGTQGNVIDANKPIALTQLQTSQTCNSNNSGGNNVAYPGDPEMTVINPIEQTLKNITLYSAISTAEAPTNIRRHYINVIIKNSGIPSLKIDGTNYPLSQFKSIDSEYSYLIADVTSSSAINPTHHITADEGFIAIAYGYGNVESYGYLAGSDLKSRVKYVESRTATGSVSDKSCQGDNINFVVGLPYQTSKITLDFGGNTVPQVIDNPVYFATELVEGITVYKYSYSKPSSLILPVGGVALKATVVNPSPLNCNPDEVLYFSFLILDPPSPSFIADSVCLGSATSFTNTTDLRNVPLKSYLWDFGNGYTSSVTNPTFTFSSPGIHLVKLTAETESGCPAVLFQKEVVVYKNPEASFTTDGSCVGRPVTFSDNSIPGDFPIVKWIWIYGDGKSDTLMTNASPSHIYQTVTTFQAQLKVISATGCISIKNLAVRIYPIPVPDFELPESCVSDVVTFLNKSSIVDNSTQQAWTYQWDFGDLGSSTDFSSAKDGVYKYSQPGTYQVSLTVRGGSGCDSTITKTFTVNGSNPKAAFQIPNENALFSDTPVSFINQSVIDNGGFGNVTKIQWYFDYDNNMADFLVDDEPAPSKVQTKSYPLHHNLTPRQYKVVLIAQSGASCVSTSLEKIILVQGVPNLAAIPDTSICMESGTFKVKPPQELAGFQLAKEFFTGTGILSSGSFNPAKAGVGIHTVTYTYVATNGSTASTSTNIEVYPTPQIQVPEEIVIDEGESAQLYAITNPLAINYVWSPGTDLSSIDVPNPIAKPKETTRYTVRVESENGCTNEASVKIRVLKTLEVPNAFSPNNDGVNDTWEIKYLNDYINFSINVFSRLGSKVYSSNGFYEPWNGKVNGTDLPGGVYYYIIEPRNGKKPITGYVTILR